MDHFTKAQRGSPSRDRFKFLHKQLLPKYAWALNSDLELVTKKPAPFVIARLDFKLDGADHISFTEAISYKQFISMPMPYTIPVYIVKAAANFKNEDEPVDRHRFHVYQLVDCDYRPFPPKTDERLLVGPVTWAGLCDWEMSLRKQRENEMAIWLRSVANSAQKQTGQALFLR